MKKAALILGAVVAAIASSECCILPLILGAAFYLTYRPARASTYTAEGECATVGWS